NTIMASIEYYHNGEGMTTNDYWNAYNYLTQSTQEGPFNVPNIGIYGFNIIQPDLIFQDYSYFTFSYTWPVQNIALSYSLDWEMESGFLKHTLTLGKTYTSVTFAGS